MATIAKNIRFPENEFINIAERIAGNGTDIVIVVPDRGKAVRMRQLFYMWRKQAMEIGALTPLISSTINEIAVTLDDSDPNNVTLCFSKTPSDWLSQALSSVSKGP